MKFYSLRSLVLLYAGKTTVAGFSTRPACIRTMAFSSSGVVLPRTMPISASTSDDSAKAKDATMPSGDESPTILSATDQLYIPLSFDEMVNQVSTAMEDAYLQGKTRQIIRVLLPRSASNDQLLQYYEDEVNSGLKETVLVPTDETWQGGIMQLYRAASFTCQAVLR